jgi:deazaflavin-dependent oxidoreductase (nitroreductase family)
LIRRLAATRPGALLLARVLPRADLALLRVTRGRRTLTRVVAGLPVVALTTVGARSGQRRTAPVLGIPIGPHVAVAAGNFGSPRTPGWCANLRADPHAHLLVDGLRRHVIARELTGAERQRVWDAGLAVYPGAAAYEHRAGGRAIAVFLLESTAR